MDDPITKLQAQAKAARQKWQEDRLAKERIADSQEILTVTLNDFNADWGHYLATKQDDSIIHIQGSPPRGKGRGDLVKVSIIAGSYYFVEG